MSKKQCNTPRRKRMKSENRVAAAAKWFVTYNGKNVIKGYSKWFGVDLLVAVKELRMAGVTINVEREDQIKNSFQATIHEKKLRKEKAALKNQFTSDEEDVTDEEYALIAGYTEGGVPYGIRWDEKEEE